MELEHSLFGLLVFTERKTFYISLYMLNFCAKLRWMSEREDVQCGTVHTGNGVAEWHRGENMDFGAPPTWVLISVRCAPKVCPFSDPGETLR